VRFGADVELSTREGGETLQTKVDTDRAVVLLRLKNILRLDQNGDIPPIGHSADRGGLNRTGEAHGFTHPDPPNDRELDPLAIDRDRIGSFGGGTIVCSERVTDPFLLELGIANVPAFLASPRAIKEILVSAAALGFSPASY